MFQEVSFNHPELPCTSALGRRCALQNALAKARIAFLLAEPPARSLRATEPGGWKP